MTERIGIIIATHQDLGKSLIDAAAFILGAPPDDVIALSIDLNEDAEKLRKKIAGGIKTLNQGGGVLILTDMFGGTPSNLSYSFLNEDNVEVLSGVNLPIVLSALNQRDRKTLSDLALDLEKVGKKSISLASALLKGGQRA